MQKVTITKSKKAATAAQAPSYVTKESFDAFGEQIAKALEAITDSVGALATREPAPPVVVATPVVEETAEQKSVRRAAANQIGVNPEWEDMAREIIGGALDHCEMQHLSNGGVIFTVVIKNEFSNAGKDYLDRMKSDRRSKDVGSEGISGVESWCKLIKANLERKT